MAKYRLRYFFDFGGSYLWAVNEEARDRFGYCVDLDELPLSKEAIDTAEKMGSWFDQSLNWDYPPDPGPWRQEECDRFNKASDELLDLIRRELGSEFEIADQQKRMIEDPDLDAYLADPKKYSRRQH